MGEPTKRLYLDLDGVMADFDAHFPAVFGLNHREMADDAMWETINAHPSYFRDMPPCPGAIEFFRSIEHLRPIILTACPKSNYPHVAAQKRAWVREHLSEHVTVLPVLGGRHKPLFMQEPGDVLIDDWPKNAVAWTAAGGIAILHRSFEETRSALAGHFPVGSTRYDDLPPGSAPAGSLCAYERAYSERHKPGEERAHLHAHLAGLRAVVLLDRQERVSVDEAVTAALDAAGRWRSAFLLTLAFTDHAAGDGWVVLGSEDTKRPRLDSQDLCIGAAEALGLDYAEAPFFNLTEEAYRAVAERVAAADKGA